MKRFISVKINAIIEQLNEVMVEIINAEYGSAAETFEYLEIYDKLEKAENELKQI